MKRDSGSSGCINRVKLERTVRVRISDYCTAYAKKRIMFYTLVSSYFMVYTVTKA